MNSLFRNFPFNESAHENFVFTESVMHNFLQTVCWCACLSIVWICEMTHEVIHMFTALEGRIERFPSSVVLELIVVCDKLYMSGLTYKSSHTSEGKDTN